MFNGGCIAINKLLFFLHNGTLPFSSDDKYEFKFTENIIIAEIIRQVIHKLFDNMVVLYSPYDAPGLHFEMLVMSKLWYSKTPVMWPLFLQIFFGHIRGVATHITGVQNNEKYNEKYDLV